MKNNPYDYCRVYSVGNKKFGVALKAVSRQSQLKGYRSCHLADMLVSFDTARELEEWIADSPDIGLTPKGIV